MPTSSLRVVALSIYVRVVRVNVTGRTPGELLAEAE